MARSRRNPAMESRWRATVSSLRTSGSTFDQMTRFFIDPTCKDRHQKLSPLEDHVHALLESRHVLAAPSKSNEIVLVKAHRN